MLLIANPAARRGKRTLASAISAFSSAGIECDARLTRGSGEASQLARADAYRFDAVFTLGGDGTAMEVVSALAHSDCPVGILPGGTGNVLARTLGTPLSIRRAVASLVQGHARRVDLGRLADGQCFACAAGVGIDSVMIEQTSATYKRRLGVMAYVLTAARAVLRNERFTLVAQVDGVRYEREAAAVMVANVGAVLNNMIALGPDIAQDDGMLDLCVFSPTSLSDAVRVLWRLARKDFRATPGLLYVQGREFLIETTPVRVAQADGELIGPTPFSVTVEPRAALLLVPPPR